MELVEIFGGIALYLSGAVFSARKLFYNMKLKHEKSKYHTSWDNCQWVKGIYRHASLALLQGLVIPFWGPFALLLKSITSVEATPAQREEEAKVLRKRISELEAEDRKYQEAAV